MLSCSLACLLCQQISLQPVHDGSDVQLIFITRCGSSLGTHIVKGDRSAFLHLVHLETRLDGVVILRVTSANVVVDYCYFVPVDEAVDGCAAVAGDAGASVVSEAGVFRAGRTCISGPEFRPLCAARK